jgi:ABC-type oligopeptide transport system substrate-binding subunit
MELVRNALSAIGIEIRPQGCRPWCNGSEWASRRGSPHAFVDVGWCEDYPDAYDFINVLLDGRTIQEENNNNLSYFDNPAYNKRMDRAAKLFGRARLKAYARLEHDLVTKAAPWAAWSQPAKQFFFSDSVDMRSFVYQPIYESPPYNVLALK